MANLSKTPENILMRVIPASEGQVVTLVLKKKPTFLWTQRILINLKKMK